MATPADFAQALRFTLQFEGGFVNHPRDPGGKTNKGVTQRVYDTFRRRQGQTPRDVRDITASEVHAIYLVGYWQGSNADDMERALATAHFDTAVNFGVGGAVKLLQRALGVEDDGDFGNRSRATLERANQSQTALRVCDLRIQHRHRRVAARPDQRVFLRGWLNRDNALRQLVSRLASGGGPLESMSSAGPEETGVVGPRRSPPSEAS